MPQSPSAALEAAWTAYVTDPKYFLEIALPSGTLRYTTAPASITYNGNSYTPADFELDGFTFGNVGNASARIDFQGVDLAFIATFRQAEAEGVGVKLWISDKLASYSSADDAVQLIDSENDRTDVQPGLVSLRLERQPIFAPFKRCDADNGFTDVTPAGLDQLPAGSQVVTP